MVTLSERIYSGGWDGDNGDVCMATAGILGNGFCGTGRPSQSTLGNQ